MKCTELSFCSRLWCVETVDNSAICRQMGCPSKRTNTPTSKWPSTCNMWDFTAVRGGKIISVSHKKYWNVAFQIYRIDTLYYLATFPTNRLGNQPDSRVQIFPKSKHFSFLTAYLLLDIIIGHKNAYNYSSYERLKLLFQQKAWKTLFHSLISLFLRRPLGIPTVNTVVAYILSLIIRDLLRSHVYKHA